MKYYKPRLILPIIIIVISMTACFKEVVEVREPLPDIIWPKPPEVTRVRFVNSISKPEDLKINDTLSKKILNILKGTVKSSIVRPHGLTTDAEDRIYVVDNSTRLIHVFDQKNNSYYTFPGKDTSFVSPIDIAIDKLGTIYVSDSQEGVIKVFKDNGKQYIKELGKGLLNRPTGLSYNNKTSELLVVDTKNSEIVKYDTNTLKFKGILGKEGNFKGLFHNPTNIFSSADGYIYVSDSLNFRIQVFTPEGKHITSFGQAGDTPGFFARPKGVATDSDGNIYVVDAMFDNVQIFNDQGELLMDFGGPGSGYGEFWLPSGIYIDSNDKIYVSDSYNNRVQIFQYMKGDDFLKP